MLEPKHTPEPWHPVEYAGYWQLNNEPFYEGNNLLSEDIYPNAEYNAKVAAAAPELFGLLTILVERMEENGLGKSFYVVRSKELLNRLTQ